MRDVLDGGIRKLGPVSIFALGATTILSLAVIFNTFSGQGGGGRFVAAEMAIPEGATTRMQVDAPVAGATTIQLKYDPVIEDVQRQLLAAGYYKGMVDGVLGKKTRNAITVYQKAADLDATGEPTAELADHIRFTREVAEASLFTGSVAASPEADRRASILRVQTGLAELAYSPGEISGELTTRTRRAIRAFQRDRQLAETGEISDDLLDELAKMSGQSGFTAE